VTLAALVRYFAWLGSAGFGGPIALVGYMQRDLVERRGWFTEAEYRQGLALAQLAPGPLAAQLAIYLGWLRYRVAGATLVALAFILPSFLMVLGLSVLYVLFGGLPWMRGLFYGVGAAVIAVIARSAVKLMRMTLGRNAFLWVLCAANAVVTAVLEAEILWVFLGSGAIAVLAANRALLGASSVLAAAPSWMLVRAAADSSAGLQFEMAWFFTKAGAVVFGSGLAIVPFLYGGVVREFGWLTEQQFLDAVAVAMITPGPVVITVAFIGYLTAGLPGAVLAASGVFLPVYLAVVLLAPAFHRVTGNASVRAFVDGVTAAATGAIAGASIVLARRAIVDLPTAAIGVATLTVIVLAKRVPEPVAILGAGLLGWWISSSRPA
jgi:chromate transporter